MAGKLTPLQERFVEEYMLVPNATDAARKAGSKAKDITAAGSELLSNPNVTAEIEKRTAARSEKTGIDAEWVLRRLAAEADADVADLYDQDGALKPVHEWPKIWRQGLVSGIEIEQITVGGVSMGTVRKVKLSDRLQRLALIGKHIRVNAFQEGVQHKGLEGLADRLARAKKRTDK